jgi:hypothetical protein
MAAPASSSYISNHPALLPAPTNPLLLPLPPSLKDDEQVSQLGQSAFLLLREPLPARKMIKIVKKKEDDVLSQIKLSLKQAQTCKSENIGGYIKEALDQIDLLLFVSFVQINGLLLEFAKLNNIESFLQAFQKIQFLNLPCSMATYGIVLSELAAKGNIQALKEAMNIFNTIPDYALLCNQQFFYSFSHLFNKVADESAELPSIILDDMLRVLKAMQQADIKPSILDANSLCKVYKKVKDKSRDQILEFNKQILRMEGNGSAHALMQGLNDDDLPDLQALSLDEKNQGGIKKGRGPTYQASAIKSEWQKSFPSPAAAPILPPAGHFIRHVSNPLNEGHMAQLNANEASKRKRPAE